MATSDGMAETNRMRQVHLVEAHAGEIRVNLIRLVAVLVFYLNHLVTHYLLLAGTPAETTFHRAVSCVALLWVLVAAVVYRWMSVEQWSVRGALFVTAADLLLVTFIMLLAQSGPRTSLVVLLLLVIAASPLRMNLTLVYWTTLGAMIAYLVALGYYAFVRIGAESYYQEGSAFRLPRGTQVVMLLALLVAGLLAGQIVRQARRTMAALAPSDEGIRR